MLSICLSAFAAVPPRFRDQVLRACDVAAASSGASRITGGSARLGLFRGFRLRSLRPARGTACVRREDRRPPEVSAQHDRVGEAAVLREEGVGERRGRRLLTTRFEWVHASRHRCRPSCPPDQFWTWKSACSASVSSRVVRSCAAVSTSSIGPQTSHSISRTMLSESYQAIAGASPRRGHRDRRAGDGQQGHPTAPVRHPHAVLPPGDEPVVAGERHRVDRALAAADDAGLLLARKVPDPHRLVAAAAREPAAVGAEGEGDHRPVVGAERPRAAGAAPDLHGAVDAAAGDRLVDRAEGDGERLARRASRRSAASRRASGPSRRRSRC